MAKTMKDRIREGYLFTDMCEGMPAERTKAKLLMKAFNETSAEEIDKRFELMEQIFGKKTGAWIEPPLYFCYGTHISIGDGCYINFNCNFVDDGQITIGERVMFGPAVTIATVGHPINPKMREYMYTDPVTIGNDCWIGGSVTICPGVTIGDNTVIGAGSVVTKDIPDWSIAAGNPCKVIRSITEDDKRLLFHNEEIDDEAWADITSRMSF